MSLQETFGDIDVYLFDQLLRGRITPDQRILDAGCGGGRNLVWLAGQGADIYAVDRDPQAMNRVRSLGIDEERARVAELEVLPFPDGSFDVVLCNAVLHFARNEAHFEDMLLELGRVLRPGGLLFARLASTIGLEERVQPLGNGRFTLPDGTERFLVDETQLIAATDRLGGQLLDPIKTTNVQGLRCMTTWVVRLSPTTKAPS